MKNFLAFRAEQQKKKEHGEIPFDKTTNHGYWDDPSKDHVIVYHGTHKRHLDSIKQNGIARKDPKTGMVSVTLDPHTAHGYASMSSAGGEHHFRSTQGKANTTAHEDRVITKFKIPKKWVHDNMDHDLSGNVGETRKRMASRDEYEKWRKANPGKSDHEYYSTSELRFKNPVPKEYYVGHAFKVKKNDNTTK